MLAIYLLAINKGNHTLIVLSIHIIVHLKNDNQAPPHPQSKSYRTSPEIPDTTSLRVRVCQGARRESPHTYTYSPSCWKPFSCNVHSVVSHSCSTYIVQYFKVLVTLRLISMILLYMSMHFY